MAAILVFPVPSTASGQLLKETSNTNCNQDLRGVSCTLYFLVAHSPLLSSWVPVRMPDEILVNYLGRIELSVRRGRDTRPQNEEDHAKLHSTETG